MRYRAPTREKLWPLQLGAGILGDVKTPEHERLAIERYLQSQSGPDFQVEHVEKLTSEYVLGQEYDVWDAHTNEGRWWVITNPTNLYSQDQIKSMDVALSFHIGLWSRVMARDAPNSMKRDPRAQELLRRLDVASESLDRAKEVEDFQAVGMRLRELLLTLTFSLSELVQTAEPTAELQKAANFKALAEIYARSLAGGKSSERLRSLLKSSSKEAWEYVSWLTHARNAGEQEARIAFSVTHQVIEAYLLAVTRTQRGQPERCPACTSYRLELVRSRDGDWVKLCAACGSASPADSPQTDQQPEDHSPEREPPESDCIEIEDFGIYLTPSQARAIAENRQSESNAEEDEPQWANPFAYALEDTLMDPHRIVFMTFDHVPPAGSELVYQCGEDSCVNAKHAVEVQLPSERPWRVGVIQEVTVRPEFLELGVGVPGTEVRHFLVKNEILDRYGLADASSLVERAVLITAPSDDGWVQMIPAARKVDYSKPSPISGWMHPSETVKPSARCPCNSGKRYSACHGKRTRRSYLDAGR